MQQHARWRLVDVLACRHQRDPGIAQRQVNRDVIGSVSGETVDLVDDAVIHLVSGDVLDHLHQLRPVSLTR
ncbi:MAG: hypothetical protein BGN97_06865 [Microbacterium sp. 69-10]|nr:MAG: hypothetical protein BGN97_06865 [Microbacterium sp. 69-10]